jgi:hypothetical protein
MLTAVEKRNKTLNKKINSQMVLMMMKNRYISLLLMVYNI